MKGLPFVPEMARAVCAGRKTVTRRLVDLPDDFVDQITPAGFCYLSVDGRWVVDCGEVRRGLILFVDGIKAPWTVGERPCVLPTWAVPAEFDHLRPLQLDVDAVRSTFWHAGMTPRKPLAAVPPLGKSRPGRFLANHLRELLPVVEIVSIGMERVQSITEDDAKAEGIESELFQGKTYFRNYQFRDHTIDRIKAFGRAADSFRTLWDSINAERGASWASNPFVWRIEFKGVTK